MSVTLEWKMKAYRHGGMIAGDWRVQAEDETGHLRVKITLPVLSHWSSKLYRHGSRVKTAWGLTSNYENRDWVHSVCETQHRSCVQVYCGPVKHWRKKLRGRTGKCVTVIPSWPQSTPVTPAPCTPPGKDVAKPFLMVAEDLHFWKKTSPPKHPFVISQWALPSASNLVDQCWTKGKSWCWGERGIRVKEPALGGSPDSLPKTLPWPALPPSLGHRTFSSSPQLGSKTWGMLATSRRGEGTLPGRRLIHSPGTFWVTALGLTGTELCWGNLSHRQNFTLLSLLVQKLKKAVQQASAGPLFLCRLILSVILIFCYSVTRCLATWPKAPFFFPLDSYKK